MDNNSWRQLKQILSKDRNDLLEQLTQELSHDNTNILRGQIRQIDMIIEAYPMRLKQPD